MDKGKVQIHLSGIRLFWILSSFYQSQLYNPFNISMCANLVIPLMLIVIRSILRDRVTQFVPYIMIGGVTNHYNLVALFNH